MERDTIDFVITWVNEKDPVWKKEKSIYTKINDDESRYRDWENLKYWFRGIEKFTPWVNKIHFITYGHLPEWLNINNPKLNIVKHKDYIPEEYLPTYNSNVIELNLNKLNSLSENFVLFNDDFFIIDNMRKEDFFVNGVPCEEYSENINMPIDYNESFSHTALNNMGIINKYYKKRNVMKKNITKYINPKYGINNIRTLCLLPWSKFSLIKDPHLPVALKKSQLNELWELEPEAFETTSRNKFRQSTDINQYLIRYMQLVKGNFIPRRSSIGKFFNIAKDKNLIPNIIKNKKFKMICLNDSKDIKNEEFKIIKNEINNSFEYILPEKSNFEI